MFLGKGEETLLILHSCARKVNPAVLLGMLCKTGGASIRLMCKCKQSGHQSCLKESSCISAMCFSFSKPYAYRDEADPEQSSLPDLRFAVPSQVSRRLAVCHNLCCWHFSSVHGCTLPLVQSRATSFVHMLFLSSACSCALHHCIQVVLSCLSSHMWSDIFCSSIISSQLSCKSNTVSCCSSAVTLT